MKGFLFLIVGLALGFAAGTSLTAQRELEVAALMQRIQSLESERTQLLQNQQRELQEQRASLKQEERGPSEDAVEQEEDSTTTARARSSLRSSMERLEPVSAVEFRANRALEGVKAHVALSDAEAELIRGRMRDLLSRGVPSEAGLLVERNQIIEEVLGTARRDALLEAERLEEQREFQKRIENEVIILSRRLQLEPHQEAPVRAALLETEIALVPERTRYAERMREMMALHYAGDEGREKLRAGYGELRAIREEIQKTKNERIASQLKGVLTDTQKNALLELQATAPDQ